MRSHFYFGSRRIDYDLIYSDRRTMGITVNPDLSVLVKVPVGAKTHYIEQKLRKRAPWIIKQQGFFLSFEPRTPARRYVSGETHLYLGRQYVLDVAIGVPETVKLEGGRLSVATADRSRVRRLVKDWYLRLGAKRINQIAEPLILKFRHHGVEPSEVQLREMPRRWGSCTRSGKIILNPELIKAPRGCIEYVIIHELCHLLHHDHTGKFFALQTKEMPEWGKWKSKLETLLA